MLDLSNYRFTALRQGDLRLLRGHAAGLDAILLVAPNDHRDSAAANLRLEHEQALQSELDAAWAVRPLALTTYEGKTALAFADPGGEPLDRLLDQPLEIRQFLRVAIPIATALRQAHSGGLMHKDIKPQNIFVDLAEGRAWLAGFGIASRMPREHQSPEPPDVIAGTLAYMAPEQTGRMNRSLDSRADLYALGITFFEMLTGQLPFVATDPMEWVHCHIARQPPRPTDKNKAIPEQLTSIVMRLLEKNAESRYQTAAGVEADLRRCLTEWEAYGEIAPFAVGANDGSDRLFVSERLYGRDQQKAILSQAFEAVALTGAPGVLLVSGFSGIGKSSVVHELHKPLVPCRGLFASGKFDQYRRDVPYDTLAQAFQNLVHPILGQKEAELGRWRETLREALEPNGILMVNLVPELELIIGKQPAVPELPVVDAQNRFQIVFRRFISVFARPEHPLALFLDDLQWADAATLDFLPHLVTHPDVRHLMVIGAYRDNFIGPGHPLPPTIEKMVANGVAVHEVKLAPLKFGDIAELVADALHCQLERAHSLAVIVHEKAAGNPFFAIQFLGELANAGLLSYDLKAAAWTWDVARIHAENYSDNVVDLMTGKLNRLPETTRSAVTHMACLGNAADTVKLARIMQESDDEVHAAVLEAVRAGLIYKLDTSYRFLHDRVQEAAYCLISEGDRLQAHLRIGRLLFADLDESSSAEDVFEAVDQLNRAVQLIHEPAERAALVRLNILAGRKAKAAAAHNSVHRFLTTAAALLPSDAWMASYANTFAFYLELSECEFVVGNFEPADELFDLMLGKAQSDLDRAKVYSLRVSLYQVAGKFKEGLAAAFEALSLFGMTFPTVDQELEDLAEVERTAIENLRGQQPIAAFVDRGECTDAEVRAVINLLVAAAPCVFIGDARFFPLVAIRGVRLSVQYGYTEQSSFVFILYAIILVSVFDVPSAAEFAELALAIDERAPDNRLTGQLLHVYVNHINLWYRPFALSVPLAERAFRACLEVGNLVYAGHLSFQTVWQSWERGALLDEVIAESSRMAAFARQSQNYGVYETIRIEQNFFRQLRGRERGGEEPGGFDEQASLDTLAETGFGSGMVFAPILKQILAFMFGRYEEALEAAEIALPSLDFVKAMPIEGSCHFFYALTILAIYSGAPAVQRSIYDARLDSIVEKFEYWAVHSPANFASRLALILGERARVSGCHLEAMRLYDDAIVGARVQGLVHIEALAHELAANFYGKTGFSTIADTYIRIARRGYLRWGADEKARQIEQLHPHLREKTPAAASVTMGAPVDGLDVATVIKASHALSGEIVLDRLIKSLMTIALEHAGANRCVLIRLHGGDMKIEAEATTGASAIEVDLTHRGVATGELPVAVLKSVIQTSQSVILEDARESIYFEDAYVRPHRPLSVLCLPLMKQAELIGALYLENSLMSGAFTPRRIAVLELVASQAAISLENARLYSGLVDEIRERQKAEQALRNAQSELARVGRVTTMGELAASIAHEMAQPLAAVAANASSGLRWLNRAEPELKEAKEALARILNDSTRAGDVMRGLRAMSRKSGPELAMLDLGQAIREILIFTRSQMERQHIKLETAGTGDDWPMKGDRVQLQQVVMNLVVNAIDAMSIKLDRAKILSISLTTTEPGAITVQVGDTGGGLVPETIDQIFDPFFTTKPDGMGMGLSICRSIIEAHGGRLRASPCLPYGTLFAFTVPTAGHD